MAGVTTLDDGPLGLEEAAPRALIRSTGRRFAVPAVRSDSVRREELLSRLEDRRERPLIVLSAPAGYGKSTLLKQWVTQSRRPAAWITLAETDRDAQLLAYVMAAARARLRGKRGGLLVLDDAHRLAPVALEDVTLALLDWLPEGSQLAVASRSVPALSLGRLRAERMLVELGPRDLSMSAVEAAWLLRRAGVEVDFTTVQTLVQRTEGWPALLELAAVAGSQPPSGEP